MTVRPPRSIVSASGPSRCAAFTMRPFLIVSADATTPRPSTNLPFTSERSPSLLRCPAFAGAVWVVAPRTREPAIAAAPAAAPAMSSRRDNVIPGLGSLHDLSDCLVTDCQNSCSGRLLYFVTSDFHRAAAPSHAR